MSNYLLHVTTAYKMGHQRFTCSAAVLGRSINYVEEVPSEVPEYSDGMLTRIQLSPGGMLYVTEPYQAVVEAWDASLESL